MELTDKIEPGIDVKYENGIVELVFEGCDAKIYIHEKGVQRFKVFLAAGANIGIDKTIEDVPPY